MGSEPKARTTTSVSRRIVRARPYCRSRVRVAATSTVGIRADQGAVPEEESRPNGEPSDTWPRPETPFKGRRRLGRRVSQDVRHRSLMPPPPRPVGTWLAIKLARDHVLRLAAHKLAEDAADDLGLVGHDDKARIAVAVTDRNPTTVDFLGQARDGSRHGRVHRGRLPIPRGQRAASAPSGRSPSRCRCCCSWIRVRCRQPRTARNSSSRCRLSSGASMPRLNNRHASGYDWNHEGPRKTPSCRLSGCGRNARGRSRHRGGPRLGRNFSRLRCDLSRSA